MDRETVIKLFCFVFSEGVRAGRLTLHRCVSNDDDDKVDCILHIHSTPPTAISSTRVSTRIEPPHPLIDSFSSFLVVNASTRRQPTHHPRLCSAMRADGCDTRVARNAAGELYHRAFFSSK